MYFGIDKTLFIADDDDEMMADQCLLLSNSISTLNLVRNDEKTIKCFNKLAVFTRLF